jgi:hypothetical protein
VPEDPPPFAQRVRHLNFLKRALERAGITAVEESNGGSYIALQVPGVPTPITCRTNPADAHRHWYYLGSEPVAVADGRVAAHEAVTKLMQISATDAKP